MAEVVIIVHPSGVLQNGLQAAVEDELKVKTLCYKHIRDIKDATLSTFSDVVILVPASTHSNELFDLLAKKTNNFYVIAIQTIDNNLHNDNFDYLYHINSPTEHLTDKIKTFLSSNTDHDDDDELSAREREVLRLIALGNTNKSIADSLYISTHTVISHRKNITEKLGIKSIPGLTVYAIMQKIISQHDFTDASFE